MQNFIIILSLLLIGMGIKRLPAFPKETGNALNLIVIYVSLPASSCSKSHNLFSPVNCSRPS